MIGVGLSDDKNYNFFNTESSDTKIDQAENWDNFVARCVFVADVVPITAMWELLSLENLMILRKSGLENGDQNFQILHTRHRFKTINLYCLETFSCRYYFLHNTCYFNLTVHFPN